MTMRQRTEPLRSKKYLAGSRGASCKLQIPGVCTGDTETTIPAHIRDRHTGRGVKASDLSVADACFACHEVFDRRAKLPTGQYLSDEDWHVYALRGLQDTLEGRQAAGLLVVSVDAVKSFHEKPAPARRPKEERTPVRPSRPLSSGNHQHTATKPPTKRVRQFARAHGDTE